PTDYTRPAVKDYEGAFVDFEITGNTYDRLKLLARENQSTMFMVLLSLFNILIARLGNQTDIVVGTPVSGRTHADLEKMVGLFMNTVAIRTKVNGTQSFKEFLKENKRNILACFENQNYPYEALVDELNITRDAGRNALFEEFFIYKNFDEPELTINEARSAAEISDHITPAKFDLTLIAAEVDSGLAFRFEYAKSLFKRSTIERFITYFNSLVLEVLQDAEARISQILMLPEKEVRQLVHGFNNTSRDYKEANLVKTMAEISDKMPDSPAILFDGESWTYEILDHESNKVAQSLLSFDFPSEAVVGIMMDRSPEMVAAILGVLKAGYVFVPIDPEYPAERIQYMVRSSGAKILIVDGEKDVDGFGNDQNLIVVNYESFHTHQSSDLPGLEVSSSSTAYIMFSSGSTGNPKGIIITHGSLYNFARAMVEKLPLDNNNRILAVTTISFDISLLEILVPLTLGKEVVLCTKEAQANPATLAKTIQEHSVDLMQFTPSRVMAFLALGNVGDILADVKTILVGGEALPLSVLEELKKVFKGRIFNMYGPTETTIWSTVKELTQEHQINIGTPIANTQIRILGENDELLPIGTTGELCIGGAGVSKGYLNNNSLTNLKFIHDPCDSKSIIYKTGDLARWLPNGDIELFGRTDDQVKIRGCRIELGEIKNAILGHNSITDAAAIVHGDMDKKVLIAYYSSKDRIDKKALQHQLRSKLPDYMIPASFVQLEKLPRTPNGKLDKKRLPAFLSDLDNYQGPVNSCQEELVNIWSKVLSIPSNKISINQSFFELGGNSINAIKLTTLIKQQLKIDLTLPLLFQNPTIEAISEIPSSDKTAALPRIVMDKENINKPFPLTDVQQAYWIGRNDYFELGNVGTHVYAESFALELDVERFEQVLNTMIERHDMLRMIVTKSGQQQILSEVPYYKIEILDLTTQPENGEVLFYELRDQLSHQLFSGDKWPLFDIRLTRFRDGSYKIHYSMDALIMDASSSVILFSEFEKLYKTPEAALDPIKISFRDYVINEIKFRESRQYEASKKYWLDRIQTIPPAPELFLSPVQPEEKPKFIRHSTRVDSQRWQLIKDKASQYNITPTVLIITCFAEVLNLWSKSSHFTLNLTTFNRLPFHEDVNKLIGDFTTLTLLEIDFSYPLLFMEMLTQVQQQLWSDLEHKHFSGVEVQRELSRKHGRTVIMPVVVTSTLGLFSDDQKGDIAEPSDEKKRSFSISQTPQVWIDFQVGEDSDGLWINWDTIDGLFPKDMLDDMFAAFENIFMSLSSDKKNWEVSDVAELPEVQTNQREKINAVSRPQTDELLHQQFLNMAEKYPQAIAIRSSKKTLTYQEVFNISNTIAYELVKLNVKKNELVAIVTEKGWEQIPSAIGILISGAAYLPVDASLPFERIKLLLQQGEVNSLLTTPHIAYKYGFDPDINVIIVDEDKKQTLEPLEATQSPDDLAYVIFTSGSTGMPKGVMIDHKGAVNTVLDINERFEVLPEDSVLGLSSLSFDLSVYDIFGILGLGGTLVIPQAHELRDPESWSDYIQKYKISVWNTVPALMQMLVDHVEKKGITLESIRLVMMSGDWIPIALPDRIKKQMPGARVMSLGGATEASIWSIYYPIDEVKTNWKSIPYGRPLANQQFHVLKPNFQPCPNYVAGDLYIGGIGLAKGYWKDEHKTQSSFVTNKITGERLYKTGDLGRYMPDGNIEFLGREDTQVKIQGYRIELGEIEAALEENSLIKSAAVVTNTIGGDSMELVAYLLPMSHQNNSEHVGYEKEDEVKITDSHQRTLFKLEQNNIRKIEPNEGDIELVKPNNDVIQLSYGTGHSEVNNALTLESFGEIFNCFRPYQDDQQIIPKYYYPSVGSLYPVQVYVSVMTDLIEGVPCGYYYYNPIHHRLSFIRSIGAHKTQAIESAPASIHLVADLNAIEPLYGKRSKVFCYQEAGYMSNLLLNTSNGFIKETAADFTAMSSAFNLSEKHMFIRSFKLDTASPDEEKDLSKTRSNNNEQIEYEINYASRKSYREYKSSDLLSIHDLTKFLGQVDLSLPKHDYTLYLIIGENFLEDFDPGLYVYDPGSNDIQYLSTSLEGNKLFPGNEIIYEQSKIGIMVVTETADIELRDRALLSGYFGQSLMSLSTDYLLGFCPIGIVDQEEVKRVANLPENVEVIHAFLGGKITQEQLTEVREDNHIRDEASEVSKIKTYLSSKLPKYMVPNHYMVIDHIPLTSNGKLDKKALPDVKVQKDKHHEPASSCTEIELTSIWSQVLNIERDIIGKSSNFFELGGHSLKAIELANAISETLNVEIPLREVFGNETLAAQAKYIDKVKESLPNGSNDNSNDKYEVII
ncbi:amino acid adenylation domain-containing protein, partial [Fulvivirga sp.]